jgi:hypothetical protein
LIGLRRSLSKPPPRHIAPRAAKTFITLIAQGAGAYSGMDKFEPAGFGTFATVAVITAAFMAYFAYDFGISSQVRTFALASAGVTALVLAIGLVSAKLGKRK